MFLPPTPHPSKEKREEGRGQEKGREWVRSNLGIHLSSRCGLLLSETRKNRRFLKSEGKLVLNSFLLLGITHPPWTAELFKPPPPLFFSESNETTHQSPWSECIWENTCPNIIQSQTVHIRHKDGEMGGWRGVCVHENIYFFWRRRAKVAWIRVTVCLCDLNLSKHANSNPQLLLRFLWAGMLLWGPCGPSLEEGGGGQSEGERHGHRNIFLLLSHPMGWKKTANQRKINKMTHIFLSCTLGGFIPWFPPRRRQITTEGLTLWRRICSILSEWVSF